MKNFLYTSTALVFGTSMAFADSIDPASFSATLGLGETVSIDKTVTIDPGRPDSALLDVMFLVDTTGSMGGVIGSVRDNASAILNELSTFGDVQFGVSAYKDITDGTPLRSPTALTSDLGAVQTGINSLTASGGGDLPELNFGGLTRVAEDTLWRPSSRRVVVWFGDAIGHDPREFEGVSYTEAGATNALLSNGVTVQAVDSGNLDGTSQASRVATATGGEIFDVLGSGAGVPAAITTAIDTSFEDYGEVSLMVSGDDSCVDVGLSDAVTGDFDRSVSRDFAFSVSFTGSAVGSCDFTVDALVDGGLVASELDSITVTSGTTTPGGPDGGPDIAPIPLPAGFPLLAAGLGLMGIAARRRRKS